MGRLEPNLVIATGGRFDTWKQTQDDAVRERLGSTAAEQAANSIFVNAAVTDFKVGGRSQPLADQVIGRRSGAPGTIRTSDPQIRSFI